MVKTVETDCPDLASQYCFFVPFAKHHQTLQYTLIVQWKPSIQKHRKHENENDCVIYWAIFEREKSRRRRERKGSVKPVRLVSYR